MPYGWVYLVTNLINGKYYIGQTTDLYKRKWNHAHPSDRDTWIAQAVRKHGWDNFVFEVLGEAYDWESLNNLESLWIIVANSIECGYNRKVGIGSPCPDTRKKMSEAQKRNPSKYWLGKKRPDTSERNRLLFTGKPSPKKGIRLKPEVVKIKKPRSGGSMPGESNPFFGKKHTSEARAKMSSKTAGRIQTESEKANRRATMLAYYATEKGKEHARSMAQKRWGK